MNSRIQDAIDALEHALKNTDKQIENNENAARLFKFFGIGLFVIGIILLIAFRFVSPPDSLPKLLFYTFPIITLMLIGTTCLRHQKNLLGEVRHFSNMKHQIELYSGLLKHLYLRLLVTMSRKKQVNMCRKPLPKSAIAC